MLSLPPRRLPSCQRQATKNIQAEQPLSGVKRAISRKISDGQLLNVRSHQEETSIGPEFRRVCGQLTANSRHTARSFLMEIDQSAGICKVHSCLSVLDVVKRPPSSAYAPGPRRQTHCRDSCHMGGRSFALYILLTSIGTRRDRRHVARLKHSRDGIHPRAILV
jgi:hypothetical protein